MPKNIPFFQLSMDGNESKYIQEVLSLEGTSKVEVLEKRFCEYIGAKYAVALSSGTAALHLAMCALDLKRGDKVICSVNAFPDLPEVVRHFDAEPIFVDINPMDYNIDLDKLETILNKNKSKKLRAVIVNHMAGKPTDLERLYAMAATNDVKVIEDASDAMGATYKEKKIGATGAAMTTFSFAPHLHKSVVQGGMLVTDDKEFYERAKLFRTHAISDESGGAYEQVEYLYDVVDIGWRYELSELNAAFCLAQFEQLDNFINRHQVIANRYIERLQEVGHIKIQAHNKDDIFRHFIIEIDKNRDHFARKLKKVGIHIGLHYIPLHFMDYYKKKYELKVFDFPVALSSYQKVMSLPIYPSLSDKEVNYICDQIINVAKEHI